MDRLEPSKRVTFAANVQEYKMYDDDTTQAGPVHRIKSSNSASHDHDHDHDHDHGDDASQPEPLHCAAPSDYDFDVTPEQEREWRQEQERMRQQVRAGAGAAGAAGAGAGAWKMNDHGQDHGHGATQPEPMHCAESSESPNSPDHGLGATQPEQLNAARPIVRPRPPAMLTSGRPMLSTAALPEHAAALAAVTPVHRVAAQRPSLLPPLAASRPSSTRPTPTLNETQPANNILPSSSRGPARKVQHWSNDEHERFLVGWSKYGKRWCEVCKIVGTRTATQCKTHAQKYSAKLEKQGHAAPPTAPDAATAPPHHGPSAPRTGQPGTRGAAPRGRGAMPEQRDAAAAAAQREEQFLEEVRAEVRLRNTQPAGYGRRWAERAARAATVENWFAGERAAGLPVPPWLGSTESTEFDCGME
eukprot:g2694.t1